MSQRRAKGPPSMANVPVDEPAGVRAERVQRVGKVVTSALEQLGPTEATVEDIVVALVMVVVLYARNSGLSHERLSELAMAGSSFADQAQDQYAENRS